MMAPYSIDCLHDVRRNYKLVASVFEVESVTVKSIISPQNTRLSELFTLSQEALEEIMENNA